MNGDLLTELVGAKLALTNPSQDLEARKSSAIIGNALMHAMPIEIQNVADLLFGEIEQSAVDFGDFPNCTPPWRIFFMSYRQPPSWKGANGVVTPLPAGIDVGILCAALTREQLGGVDCTGFTDAHRWWLYTVVFERSPEQTTLLRLGFPIKPDGEIGAGAAETPRYLAGWPDCESTRLPADLGRDLLLLAPALLTISLCYCKNAELRSEPVPHEVYVERIRTWGWSPHTVHTLNIEPRQETLREYRSWCGRR